MAVTIAKQTAENQVGVFDVLPPTYSTGPVQYEGVTGLMA